MRFKHSNEGWHRVNTLFCVRQAKQFVEHWLKLNFTPPPIVIVLSAFSAHEKPSVIDLAAGAHNRHAAAFADPHTCLFFVGQS
jgi:hypothetical protein